MIRDIKDEEILQHYGCTPSEDENVTVLDNKEFDRQLFGIPALFHGMRFEAKIYYDPQYDKFLVVKCRILPPKKQEAEK